MPRLVDYPPMLLEERPFAFGEPDWIYEIKFDGYRLMALIDGGHVELRSRQGADATRWFPELVDSLATLYGGPTILDGEVCVLDEAGRSDFDRLHDRARRRRWYAGADAVTFCVFDLLMVGGDELLQLPLLRRKTSLRRLLKSPPAHVMPVGHFAAGEGAQIFQQAVIPLGLEGLCAKRTRSLYVPGARSPDWIKIKRAGAVPPERFRRGAKPALASGV